MFYFSVNWVVSPLTIKVMYDKTDHKYFTSIVMGWI